MTVHVVSLPRSGNPREMIRFGRILAERHGSGLMAHINRSQFSRFAAAEFEQAVSKTGGVLANIDERSLALISDIDPVVFGCWPTYTELLVDIPGQTSRLIYYPVHDPRPTDRLLAYRDIGRVLIQAKDWFGVLSAGSSVGTHVDIGLPTNPLLSLRSRSMPPELVGTINESGAFRQSPHAAQLQQRSDRIALVRCVGTIDVPAADVQSVLHAIAARARVVIRGELHDDVLKRIDGLAMGRPGEETSSAGQRADPDRAINSLRRVIDQKLETAADRILMSTYDSGSPRSVTA